jgi:hypothetical protein
MLKKVYDSPCEYVYIIRVWYIILYGFAVNVYGHNMFVFYLHT